MAPQSSAAAKRGPTVLVTDSREHPRPPIGRKSTSRFITVDSVLQYASEVPSMQQRQPQRPKTVRTPSGRPADPRLTGRFAPPHMPPRSTKLSEKLVLLPETDSADADDEKGDFDEDNEEAPLRDDEEARRPGREKAKSYAERLPKSRRTEKELARVTAYCTAQAYKMSSTAAFIRDAHGARTKLYDDCLYAAYHLPLLPGTEGYRIRSSPMLKGARGKAVLDEAIERSERRTYHEGYFVEDDEQHSVRGGGSPRGSDENVPTLKTVQENGYDRRDSRDSNNERSESPTNAQIPASVTTFAEAFIFGYGVVVFWNFSERQEKDILADLTFSSSLGAKVEIPAAIASLASLATLPLSEDEFETEEFHFEYSNEISRPRLFNDMITLRSGDHMIKLTMSHAIAQSTKLSFFEQKMADQMDEAKDVPRRLALTGELGMKREEVTKILGRIFKSRVDVNLSSNMLDVPNFFWEAEPTLHPLYTAVREYLEIKPRIQVLNERCRVFLDLAEILSDAIADNKTSRQTWIIIVLIVISILVTCSEVFLRFGMLSTKGTKTPAICPELQHSLGSELR